jgi:hypothetical protein
VKTCAYLASRFGAETVGCHQRNPATCLCTNNAAQSSSIASYASNCALSSCSNDVDAASAAGIFGQYCSVNGAIFEEAVVTSVDAVGGGDSGGLTNFH